MSTEPGRSRILGLQGLSNAGYIWHAKMLYHRFCTVHLGDSGLQAYTSSLVCLDRLVLKFQEIAAECMIPVQSPVSA